MGVDLIILLDPNPELSGLERVTLNTVLWGDEVVFEKGIEQTCRPGILVYYYVQLGACAVRKF